MSQHVEQHRQPKATPVGHSGIRVEIEERSAWVISGWFGVLVVAACIAATIVIAQGSTAWRRQGYLRVVATAAVEILPR